MPARSAILVKLHQMNWSGQGHGCSQSRGRGQRGRSSQIGSTQVTFTIHTARQTPGCRQSSSIRPPGSTFWHNVRIPMQTFPLLQNRTVFNTYD